MAGHPLRKKAHMAWYDLTSVERARALAAIWHQHGRTLAMEATRNYAGSGSADDFLMDLIEKILTSPPDVPVEHGAPVGPWVTSVIRNKRRDAYRAENRHRRILREAHSQPGHWLSERPGESAEQVVVRRMAHADVLRRIGRLPGHLRDAALLRYDGYSYAEIGRALGISDVAARARTCGSGRPVSAGSSTNRTCANPGLTMIQAALTAEPGPRIRPRSTYLTIYQALPAGACMPGQHRAAVNPVPGTASDHGIPLTARNVT